MPTKKFNISLPADLVKKADRAAREEYRTRSELIREALRLYLLDQEEWEKFIAYRKRKAPPAPYRRPRGGETALRAIRRQKRLREL